MKADLQFSVYKALLGKQKDVMDVISGLEDVEYAKTFRVQVRVYDELLEFLIRSFNGAQVDKFLHSVGDANKNIEEFSLNLSSKNPLMLFYRDMLGE